MLSFPQCLFRRASFFQTVAKALGIAFALCALQGCDELGGGGGFRGRTEVAPVLGSIILGAAFGAFFSQKLRKFRRVLILVILGLIALAILFSGPPWAYIGWFFIAMETAWMLLRDKFGSRGRKLTTFGSAEWANLDYLARNQLTGDSGFWLGNFIGEGRRTPVHYMGDRHLLTVAPTRAGKGVSAIIPNLLTYKGSALVIDPKGENAMITARQRAALGQAIHVVDPWGITGMATSRFNPLDWLLPEDPDLGENALMLADAMVVRAGGKGDNAFWDEESIALLWGFIMYVALDEPGRDRSLGGVRELISLAEEPMNELLKKMYEHPNEIVSGTAARTLSKEPKVRSNVFTSLQSHTHFLDSPRMRESLSHSDFRFEDLKATKMTVYMVLPADRLGTFGRWLRLLIQQAITVNARNIELKPDKPILFLLDEMAALGRLTKVEEAYGLMAGFGMQLWGIVQDLSQLDRIYDKGWETFIGNSGVLQYFGSRDQKTAEYFSKLCGVSTVEVVSFSQAIARAMGFDPGNPGKGNTATQTDTTSTNVQQRPLVYPDELMVMRKGQSLLLIENNYPIQAERIIWHADDRLKALGVSLQGSKPAVPSTI